MLGLKLNHVNKKGPLGRMYTSVLVMNSPLLIGSEWWLACDSVHFDGLVQDTRNPSALAMELRLSCINPSNWCDNILTCRLGQHSQHNR